MNNLIKLLNANDRVSDWKINTHQKESYELFFVKGKLETVRCTDQNFLFGQDQKLNYILHFHLLSI